MFTKSRCSHFLLVTCYFYLGILKGTGISKAKKAEILETMENAVYPIPENRVLELLKEAGFGKMIRFYTGFWVGGWMCMKS